MPLLHGAEARTRSGFSENIRREVSAGKPQRQAVAIAYSEAGEHKRHKEHMKEHKFDHNHGYRPKGL